MAPSEPKAASQCLKGRHPLDRAIVHGGKMRSTLKQGRFSSDITKNICTVRIVKHWKRLPRLLHPCPWRFLRLVWIKP